jgi:hypothetical protein
LRPADGRLERERCDEPARRTRDVPVGPARGDGDRQRDADADKQHHQVGMELRDRAGLDVDALRGRVAGVRPGAGHDGAGAEHGEGERPRHRAEAAQQGVHRPCCGGGPVARPPPQHGRR